MGEKGIMTLWQKKEGEDCHSQKEATSIYMNIYMLYILNLHLHPRH